MNGLEQLFEALDWLHDGVILLDAEGRALFSNSAARETARRGDGIALNAGHLELAYVSSPASSLAEGLAAFRQGRAAALADFIVGRGNALPPYTLSLRPVGQGAPDTAVAMLFIHDPLREDAGAELLRAAFGLTAAEAHLAAALRRGFSPGAYAAAHQLSANTVNTHLKRIKEKCGQGRLSELVRLLNQIRTAAAPAEGPASTLPLGSPNPVTPPKRNLDTL